MNGYKMLAIDTSTDACSVAISVNGQLTDRFELAPQAHTKLILPMVEALLKETNLSLIDLDAFAFGAGPGSFTGLRIAAAIIQGFSFATQKPVVPVSTLRALAQAAFRETAAKEVFAWLDARLQQFYWGLYRIDNQNIMQAVSVEKVEALEKIQLPKGNWHKYTGFPRASDIATLALAEYNAGNFVSAEKALPVYIRDNVVK